MTSAINLQNPFGWRTLSFALLSYCLISVITGLQPRLGLSEFEIHSPPLETETTSPFVHNNQTVIPLRKSHSISIDNIDDEATFFTGPIFSFRAGDKAFRFVRIQPFQTHRYFLYNPRAPPLSV